MCSTQNTENVGHSLEIHTPKQYLDHLLDMLPMLAMLLYDIRVISA